MNHYNYYLPTSKLRKERIPNGYMIKKHQGKLKQRIFNLLFNLLNRVSDIEGSYCYREELHWKAVPIDLSKIEQAIFDYMDKVNFNFNCKCRMILLGRKELSLLEYNADIPFSFTFPNNYRSLNQTSYNFAGVEVVCVPWIKGIVVIPETR